MQIIRRNSKGQFIKGFSYGFMVNRQGKNNPFFGEKHSEESKEKMRLAKLGKPGPWHGKKRPEIRTWFDTPEVRKKISEAHKGKIVSEITRKKLSISHRGQHNSPNTEFKKGHKTWYKGKKRIDMLGNQFAKLGKGNWRGGITSLSIKIRHCFKNRQWRSDCFTRDNFTCQICGVRGGNLEVDHYPKMFSVIFQENNISSLEEALNCEEFWNLNNGRTLCQRCHNKTKIGKSK